MGASYTDIQKRLKAFDFKGLFTQELMWNHFQAGNLEVKVDCDSAEGVADRRQRELVRRHGQRERRRAALRGSHRERQEPRERSSDGDLIKNGNSRQPRPLSAALQSAPHRGVVPAGTGMLVNCGRSQPIRNPGRVTVNASADARYSRTITSSMK